MDLFPKLRPSDGRDSPRGGVHAGVDVMQGCHIRRIHESGRPEPHRDQRGDAVRGMTRLGTPQDYGRNPMDLMHCGGDGRGWDGGGRRSDAGGEETGVQPSDFNPEFVEFDFGKPQVTSDPDVLPRRASSSDGYHERKRVSQPTKEAGEKSDEFRVILAREKDRPADGENDRGRRRPVNRGHVSATEVFALLRLSLCGASPHMVI